MSSSIAPKSLSSAASSITSRPWFFFLVTLCWSWLFWIPAATLKTGINTPVGAAFALVGLLGPMLGGILCTYLTQGSEGRREYWSRIFDAKRIGARWYLVIFFLTPLLMSITAGLDLFTGGSRLPFERAFAPFLAQPLTLLPFALGIFFLGPFPEELGWRGYALDRLLVKWNAVTASLVLGLVWALWHLPLFFIKGTYQYSQGAWTAWFWLFMIGIPPLSVVFTWIFNNTRRSTLATILFHFTIVFTDELLNVTTRTDLYSTGLWILVAVIVTSIGGAGTLRHRKVVSRVSLEDVKIHEPAEA